MASSSRSWLKSAKSPTSLTVSSGRHRVSAVSTKSYEFKTPLNTSSTRSSGRYSFRKGRSLPLDFNHISTSRDKRDYSRDLHESFTSDHGLSVEEITCDEIDDMLPKTDYTYARSESYSPEYSGNNYISPNMSRRRLRSSKPVFLSDDEEEFSRYENEREAVSNYRVYTHHSQTTTESAAETSTAESQRFGIAKVQHAFTSTPVTSYRQQHLSTNDHHTDGIVLRSGSHLKGVRRHSRDYESVRSESNALRVQEALHSNVDSSAYRSDVDGAWDHRRGDRNVIITETTTTITTTSTQQPQAGKDQNQRNAVNVEDHSENKLKFDESQTEKDINKQEYKLNHLYGLDYEDEISDVDDMKSWEVSSKHKYHSQNASSLISYIFTIVTTVVTTVTSTFSDGGDTSFVKPLSVAASKLVVTPGRWLIHSLGSWARWLITRSAYFLLWDVSVKQRRRRECCCCLLPLLFLLPLLLLGSYYSSGLQENMGAYISDTRQMFSSSWSSLWFTHSSSQVPFSTHPQPASIPTSVPLPAYSIEKEHQIDMTQIYEYIQQIVAATTASKREERRPELTKEEVETIVKGLLASSVRETSTMLKAQVDAMKILLQGDIALLQQKITGLEAEIKTTVDAHHNALRRSAIKAERCNVCVEESFTAAEAKQKIRCASSLMLTNKLDQGTDSSEGWDGQKVDWLAASQAYEEKLTNLTQEINNLSSQYVSLNARLANCCRNNSDFDGIIKAHVFSVLSQMSTDKDSPLASLLVQMGQHYVDRAEMDQRLAAIKVQVMENVKVTLAETEEKANITAGSLETLITSINESAVKSIIEEALIQFSADRVGMPDFALESAGGSVISVRCSETYYKKTALVSIFGFPLWYTSNSPRAVIQPNVHPGECWAFKGHTGYIVFQLSHPILPTGFTLEHIPRSLAPNGNISSAPKDFAVFGLISDSDTQGINLGNYTYLDNERPIQFFPVQNRHPGIFQLIELRVLDNHGNIDYTCIYRFRVHVMSHLKSSEGLLTTVNAIDQMYVFRWLLKQNAEHIWESIQYSDAGS